MFGKASKLEPFSLGVVGANKPTNSKVIEVSPYEHYPLLDGYVTDGSSTTSSQAQSSSGRQTSTELMSTATISATWLSMFNTNRITPPDVRVGEIVMIYKFADADNYYWVDYKTDLQLRKKETVTWAFSNVVNETDVIDETNAYWFHISAHNKLVSFSTPNNDGELTTFGVNFDTANGLFIIQSGLGHHIVLDAKNDSFEAYIDENNNIRLNKGVLSGKVSNKITLDTPEVEVTNNLTVKGRTTFKGQISGNSWNVGTDGVFTTKDINTTGNIHVSGNINADGTVHGSNI